MKRLRHQIALVWLALFALVSDMALIAPHHHDAPGIGARAVTAGLSAVALSGPCLPGLPHNHDHDCAVCWTAAIAGTGVVPVAPTVPVAPSWVSLRQALPQPAVVVQPVNRGFRARGPPTLQMA